MISTFAVAVSLMGITMAPPAPLPPYFLTGYTTRYEPSWAEHRINGNVQQPERAMFYIAPRD